MRRGRGPVLLARASVLTLALATVLAATPSPAALTRGGRTERASVPRPRLIAGAPAISADGRYVAFASDGSSFVPSDANGAYDVFVHDLVTETYLRVSAPPGGGDADGDSRQPAISHDGRYVAFTSGATNLVPGVIDTNAADDVFVRDLCLGAPACTPSTMLVSVSEVAGRTGDRASSDPQISSDGMFVSFGSEATDLTPENDAGAFRDVFVRNVVAGWTQRITVASSGGEPNGASGDPSVVADLRRRAFVNEPFDGPCPGGATSGPRCPAVAFASSAADLRGAGPGNFAFQVYVAQVCGPACVPKVAIASARDTATGQQPGNDDSVDPALHGDLVAFTSRASDLHGAEVDGDADCDLDCDANGVEDIYIAALAGPRSTRIARVTAPQAPATGEANLSGSNAAIGTEEPRAPVTAPTLPGTQANGASFEPSFPVPAPAAAGSEPTILAFTSEASNLVDGDANGVADVFSVEIRNPGIEIAVGRIVRASSTPGGVEANAASASPAVVTQTLQGEVRRFRIAFVSQASNLAAHDSNGATDVFVRKQDLDAGQTPFLARSPVSLARVSGTGTTEADGTHDGPTVDASGRYVAFTSTAAGLAAGASACMPDCTQVFVRDRETRSTTQVSVASDGTPAAGPSGDAMISADGRYVVFASTARNLVAPAVQVKLPAGASQIYLHDRSDGSTEIISTTATGEPGNAGSYEPFIAGNTLAFSSDATNLVADTRTDNGVRDIFLKDLSSGLVLLVSRAGNSAGSDPRANGPSRSPAMTTGAPDERLLVAFESEADNLDLGDRNGATTDIFVRPMRGTDGSLCVTPFTPGCDPGSGYRVTRAAQTGAHPDGPSTDPSISPDGTAIAFTSAATNLVRAPDTNGNGRCDDLGCDTNGVPDVFLRATQFPGREITYRVSVAADGGDANGPSADPYVTDEIDVAFTSAATNLVAGPAGAAGTHVYVRALLEGSVTTRLSSSSQGAPGDGDSAQPSGLRRDPYADTIRYGAVFSSRATNLTEPPFDACIGCPPRGDTDGDADVVVVDERDGLLRGSVATQRESAAPSEPDDLSSQSSLAGDGRLVAFTSAAMNLVDRTPEADTDVFVRRTVCSRGRSLCDHEVTLVSRANGIAGRPGDGRSYGPSLAESGVAVAFTSRATNLAGSNPWTSDVFVRDLAQNRTELISYALTSDRANGDSHSPAISRGGRYVSFVSLGDNMDTAEAGGRTNASYDIFIRDRATGALIRASKATSGVADRGSSSPSIASLPPAGANPVSGPEATCRASFISVARNLVSPPLNLARAQAYVYDCATDRVALVSADAAGIAADTGVQQVEMSPDGGWVAFVSNALNLAVANAAAPGMYAYLADCRRVAIDRSCRPPTIVSVDHAGRPAEVLATQPLALSRDAATVAFVSAGALVPEDTPPGAPGAVPDVYIRHSRSQLAAGVETGTTERVSVMHATPEIGGDAGSYQPAISPDGSTVAFTTAASNLIDPTPDDNRRCDVDGDGDADDNCQDIYLRVLREPDDADVSALSG